MTSVECFWGSMTVQEGHVALIGDNRSSMHRSNNDHLKNQLFKNSEHNQYQVIMVGIQSQLFFCFTDTDDAVTVNISTC